MSEPAPPLHLRELGVVPYDEALALQHELVAARQRDEIGDTLLLLEHPPVITLGRRRDARANVLTPGDIPVVRVERGGDATFHGPGQLVGYPIVLLREHERDLHVLLRKLEDAVISLLAACDLRGERNPGHTGVWCEGKKLASIGVAVRRWVTFHGFALNLTTDLADFARLNPCGLDSGVMASVTSLGGRVPEPAELARVAHRATASALGRSLK